MSLVKEPVCAFSLSLAQFQDHVHRIYEYHVPVFLRRHTKGTFFWAYSGIGLVRISQTIVPSRATLIPEWL